MLTSSDIGLATGTNGAAPRCQRSRTKGMKKTAVNFPLVALGVGGSDRGFFLRMKKGSAERTEFDK